MSEPDTIRDLLGPRRRDSAERLIADAQVGGWLPDLVGWVRVWAAAQVHFQCARCQGHTTRLCSVCETCFRAEDARRSLPVPVQDLTHAEIAADLRSIFRKAP